MGQKLTSESQSKSINDQVVRKLTSLLYKNNGIYTFVPQTWKEFYVQACNGNQSNTMPKKRLETVEDSSIAMPWDFLSQYAHIFFHSVKEGGQLIEVKVNIQLGVCKRNLQTDGGCHDAACKSLHCCSFYLVGGCIYGDSCRFPHTLTTDHNASLLRRHLLDGLSVSELSVLLCATVLQICLSYSEKAGCLVGNDCLKLHLCSNFIEGKCKDTECKRSHDVLSEQSKSVLMKHGFNLYLGADSILAKLRLKLKDAGKCDNVSGNRNASRRALQICYKYNSKDGCQYGSQCQRLHLCRRYALHGQCLVAQCGGCHDVMADQPRGLLVKYGFNTADGTDQILAKLRQDLCKIIGVDGNEQKASCSLSAEFRDTPNVCFKYNSREGCDLGDSCRRLHLCYRYATDKCNVASCRGCHDITAHQPLRILTDYGYDINKEGTDHVLVQLRISLAQRIVSRRTLLTSKTQTSAVNKKLDTCFYYHAGNNSKGGCKLGQMCPKLHVCRQFLLRQCESEQCQWSHDLTTEHTKRILMGFELNVVAQDTMHIREKIKSILEASNGVNNSDLDKRVSNNPRQQQLTVQEQKREKPLISMSIEKNENIKICSFHLFNRCVLHNDCCNYHSPSKLPYQWQWKCSTLDCNDFADEQWHDFGPAANVEIESQYCDAAENRLKVRDDVGGEVFINFESMVFTIIEDVTTGEVRRLGTESAAAATKRNRYTTVWVWYWQTNDGSWQAYPNAVDDSGVYADSSSNANVVESYQIERRYLANPIARWQCQADNGSKFCFDLKQMTLTSLSTLDLSRLRRRPEIYSARDTTEHEESTIAATGSAETRRYPKYWDADAMKNESIDYVLIPLTNCGPMTEEYQMVAARFGKTMPEVELRTIRRIQNRDMWESYDAFRTRMNRKRSKPASQLALFHGTRKQYVEAICQQGFDWRMCGTSVGTKWGKGNYFARDASYSNCYTDCKIMFLVQVRNSQKIMYTMLHRG
jgi:poly [ADP-ribose] polymerase 7/11/12/13